VLERDDGFTTTCKIIGIVGGKCATLGEEAHALGSNDMTLFTHILDIV